MTPLEAIIKNVIAIGLLLVLLNLLKNKPDVKSNFWILSTVTIACILGVFMLTFSQPSTENNLPIPITSDAAIDENANEAPSIMPSDIKINAEPSAITKVTPTQNVVEEKAQLPTVKSGYAKYFADIDSGTKILCFFAPGCPHCAKTASELTAMSAKDKNFPKIQIIFMDEESNLIPEFFVSAGAKYNYKIVDIIGFWKILGPNKDVPGVKLLKNGKELLYFYGTAENTFDQAQLLKILNANN